MRSTGLGLALRPRTLAMPAGISTPTPTPSPAPISSINAEGWSAEWAGGTPPTFAPDIAPQTIAVLRAGFDATGAAVTHAITRTFTRRKRQAYPNHLADTLATVALDDYVYATDAIAGVANASTETSPKPVAAWAMPHRAVVGNSLPLELVAFHRDARAGRMIAAVKFIATDGTSTVTQTVAATTLSTRAGDRQPLPVYAATLDISGLATGLVTVNAEVYPWIGAAASVLKSVDQTALREFSPRYFLRNPSLAANPPFAYVAAGGSDATGVVSTIAATAAAAPFASIKGAIDALHTAFSGTTGVDGCVVRIGAGTFPMASATTNRTQKMGWLTIERDPAVARASAVVAFGAVAVSPKLAAGLTVPSATGCLRFHDVTVRRVGGSFLQGETAARLELVWDDVDLDNGGFAAWLTRSDNAFHGVAVTNPGGGWLAASGNGEQRIVRGVQADFADDNSTWENWVTLACAFTRCRSAAHRDPTKGAIVFQNRFLNPYPTAILLPISTANAAETITGFWVVQNLVEVTRATAGAMLRVSADSISHGDTVHCGVMHNSFTGYGQVGRYNFLYDSNTTTEVRNHRLAAHRHDIVVQLNTKGDVNVGTSGADPTDAPLHLGQLAYHHGVGCRANWTQFLPNAGAGASEQQVYGGLGTVLATSATVRNDPGFTAYAGVGGSGGTASAGAGGGDYRLTPDAPARGIAPVAVLSHDLAGAARPATGDTPGCYA